MSEPRLEIGPHNWPRFDDLSGGAISLSPLKTVRCSYHQPGVYFVVVASWLAVAAWALNSAWSLGV
jgi:hypothetical protein